MTAQIQSEHSDHMDQTPAGLHLTAHVRALNGAFGFSSHHVNRDVFHNAKAFFFITCISSPASL